MLAAYNDHPKTVTLLLESGADVDRRNDRGQTPLAGVAFKGYLEVAKLLLAAGADPLASQGMEMTPIRFAEMFGQTEMEALLTSSI